MFQSVITRKNLIAISLSVFYSLLLLFTGMCLDTDSNFVSKNNPISLLGNVLGFQPINTSVSAFLCLILVAIYIIILVGAICYERRYAIVNGKKPFSPKMIINYIITFFICAALSLGFGILIQMPIDGAGVLLILQYVWQTMVLSLIIYAVLFIAIGAVVMLVVNFILVDKPYKFFNKTAEAVLEDEIEASVDLASSFDATADGSLSEGGSGDGSGGGYGGGGGGGSGEGGETVVKSSEQLEDREKVFPALSKIDLEQEGFVGEALASDDITLPELCEGFRNYLAKDEKLYFDIDVIRFFISGFAASHFEILEGLSGTGKSSLPRYFAKYANADVLFMPVQATWRDKSNILGFFNEFSKTYTETDFLCSLYRAAYNPDRINFFVLDEMNISRVEYYFADLLSVLEYPVESWKLKLMQLPYGFVPPVLIEDGFVKITENCYFVGTANKDDSTFTITDKVYDRAITIDFTENNSAFEVTEDTHPITLGHSKLKALFNEALENEEYKLHDDDYEKLHEIFDYVYDRFDIALGNRILNQIDHIVPVFVAAGGTKECAIDFMISKKLVSKIEGRFEEHIKDSLNGLLALLDKVYGAGVMARTEKVARTIIRNL